MKRIHTIFPLALAAAALIHGSCSGASEQSTTAASADTAENTYPQITHATKAPMIETDSVHWADTLVIGKCKAKALVQGRYPTAGTTRLVDSVRQWLADNLSYSMQDTGQQLFRPTPAELASGQKLVARSGKALLESARNDFEDFDTEGYSMSYEYSYSFGPIYETDSLLTYSFSGYIYLGGAHGGALGSGQTFAASTGRKLNDSDIFQPGKEKEVIRLVKDALWQQYFKEGSEEGATLKDALLINPDTLRLPQQPPLFCKDGLVFTYQQYEIAPYSAGMPSVTVPF
ncbi:MAG: RsiV family protein, partial [Muribaculaceae bacterium]|nr:RsiV family protein [Muribaculaceae bacterium]